MNRIEARGVGKQVAFIRHVPAPIAQHDARIADCDILTVCAAAGAAV